MTLQQAQAKFTRKIALLILWADSKNYDLTFGEAYESPDEANPEHLKTGQHPKRLAIDLNLFIAGQYRKDTEAYAELGAFWILLSEPGLLCRWGGTFSNVKDGGHFECVQKEEIKNG